MNRQLRFTLLFRCVIAVYLLLGTGFLLTRAPQVDEGTLGNAAYLLATKGYLGMPTLEQAGSAWLRGLDRYVYWVMPMHMVLTAACYKIFGAGLFVQRGLSLGCGLLAAISWFWIVRKLTASRWIALLCFALLALNYDLLNVASNGRTDVPCIAFYAAGMAGYLVLREKNLLLAMAVSHTLLACSLLTHPFAGFGMVGVLFFMLYFDRRELRLSHLAIGALPYLIAILAWGAYAMQNPEIARAQLFGNVAAGRLGGLVAPFQTLGREIQQRYLILFGGWRAGVPPAMRLRILILLCYWGSAAILLLTPWMRRKRGYGVLLFLTALYFLMLTYLENLKWYVYLIHILPVYTCLFGALAGACWEGKPGTGRPLLPRSLIAAAVAGFLIFNVGSVVYRMRLNPYRDAFQPTANYLRKVLQPGDLVMASSEFAFPLGFNGQLTDDYRLGFLSGKAPALIVVDKRYQEWFDAFSSQPDQNNHIQRLLQRERVLLFEVSKGYEWYKVYGPADRRAGAD